MLLCALSALVLSACPWRNWHRVRFIISFFFLLLLFFPPFPWSEAARPRAKKTGLAAWLVGLASAAMKINVPRLSCQPRFNFSNWEKRLPKYKASARFSTISHGWDAPLGLHSNRKIPVLLGTEKQSPLSLFRHGCQGGNAEQKKKKNEVNSVPDRAEKPPPKESWTVISCFSPVI